MAKAKNVIRRYRSSNSGDVAQAMEAFDSGVNLDGTRGFDAFKTDRTNCTEWLSADGAHINRLIETQLPTLWARSHDEYLNNPMVAGVIETHKAAFVGDTGPKLQVISDNDRYNELLEDLWEETWENIDVYGNVNGPELLRLMLHSFWIRGDMFLLETNDRDPSTTISYRVAFLDAQRIKTAWKNLGDMNVLAGIRRTPRGRVISYDFAEPLPIRLESYTVSPGVQGGNTYRFVTYPAARIIHQFRVDEAEQVRGYPWLSQVLQVSRDVRDYDEKVLDTMRLVASQSVVWSTEHPRLRPMQITKGQSMGIERNTQFTGPPGWRPTVLDPKNPSSEYVNWRSERHRELGRMATMPLLLVRQGAEEHNFSSARFDGMFFGLGINALRRATERKTLNRMVDQVAREASFFILPDRPERVRYNWQWPAMPQVDPQKEALADEINYRNGFIDLGTVAAKHNLTVEELIRRREREQQALEAAGLTAGNNEEQAEPQNAEPAETSE